MDAVADDVEFNTSCSDVGDNIDEHERSNEYSITNLRIFSCVYENHNNLIILTQTVII